MVDLRKLAFVLLVTAATTSASAQINAVDAPGFFCRGKAMFHDNNYIGADAQLRQALRMPGLSDACRTDAALTLALDALNEGHTVRAHAMLQQWLLENPESTLREYARMCLGDCFFGKSYAEALKYYLQVDPQALTLPQRETLDYRIGYSALQLAEFNRAESAYQALATSKEYAQAARFYLGYIAYVRGDFPRATTYLSEADGPVAPGNMAGYYLSQINYVQGNYRQALDYAKRLLTRRDIPQAFAAEANRITGESLYQTGKPSDAIPYLEHYIRLTDKPLLSAQYILGLAEYADGNYAKAVKWLTPVREDQSSMGQNASVYLGQALLKTGDVDGAILAFDRAIHMNCDPAARENAYYNYAVAKFSGASVPFASSVATLEAFLREYPDSRYAEDVRRYIITGYMTDNNYTAALEAINRIHNPSETVLRAKLQVLYTLGTRELIAGQTDKALITLSQAEKLARYDATTANEVNLSLGETYLRRGDYAKAAEILRRYNMRTGSNAFVALYDLGYALMGTHDYPAAYQAFEKAQKLADTSAPALRADVLTRMADCQYYQRNWHAANNLYTQAQSVNPSGADYAVFQQAVIRGYNNDFTGKLQLLDDMRNDYPTSALIPDAMLETTEAYLQLNRRQDAIRMWRRLIADYPNTAQGRQAYLQLALALTEDGDTDQAVAALKALIAKYPTSDEASQASESYKHISARRGTLGEFEDFMAGIESAPQTDPAELDRLAFDAAEEAFLDGKGTALLEDYIKRHNNGAFAVQAYEYLMDEADSQGQPDKAYQYAVIVTDRWPDNDAAELAYAIRGEREYAIGDAEQSLQSWSQLEKRASTPAMVNEARMGIMRAARDLGMADRVQQAAETVLASSAPGTEQKTEAQFSLGLAHSLKGDDTGAIQQWSPIASVTDDIYGAKAAVYLAEKHLEKGNTKDALATAQALVNSGTPHQYWLARGFIVLSDAYRAQGKSFEADEYLRALRENYPGSETDIFNAIDERLGK